MKQALKDFRESTEKIKNMSNELRILNCILECSGSKSICCGKTQHRQITDMRHSVYPVAPGFQPTVQALFLPLPTWTVMPAQRPRTTTIF